MDLTIYNIGEGYNFPWRWKLTRKNGDLLADGYALTEKDAACAGYDIKNAIEEQDADEL